MSSGIVLIAGLGNPGDGYRETRHNVGYMVVDELARQTRSPFRPGRGEFWEAEIGLGGERMLLLKPTTYMNRSGLAVQQVQNFRSLLPEQTLVVLDDVYLPLGRLRIRREGSDGGHNGLASVIAEAGTDRIPRLRCGVGPEVPPPGDSLADFVLSPFVVQEREAVRAMIVRATEAIREIAQSGWDRAMSIYNTTP